MTITIRQARGCMFEIGCQVLLSASPLPPQFLLSLSTTLTNILVTVVVRSEVFVLTLPFPPCHWSCISDDTGWHFSEQRSGKKHSDKHQPEAGQVCEHCDLFFCSKRERLRMCETIDRQTLTEATFAAPCSILQQRWDLVAKSLLFIPV